MQREPVGATHQIESERARSTIVRWLTKAAKRIWI